MTKNIGKFIAEMIPDFFIENELLPFQDNKMYTSTAETEYIMSDINNLLNVINDNNSPNFNNHVANLYRKLLELKENAEAGDPMAMSYMANFAHQAGKRKACKRYIRKVLKSGYGKLVEDLINEYNINIPNDDGLNNTKNEFGKFSIWYVVHAIFSLASLFLTATSLGILLTQGYQQGIVIMLVIVNLAAYKSYRKIEMRLMIKFLFINFLWFVLAVLAQK